MSVNLEPVATTPAEKPSTEPVQEALTPLEKKYGGDKTKINEGYWNLNQELSRKNEALNQLVERTRQLEAIVGAVLGGQNGQPADPSLELAQELGLSSPEPLKKGVRSEVESVLTELFGPFVKQMEADEKLASEIDNFEALRSEARVFMKANPEVAETFNAVRGVNAERAWKYAIREMLASKGSVPSPGANAIGLPGGATPQGRGQAPLPVEQASREAEALKYGREYGDMSHYRHERFKGTSIQRAIERANDQAGIENRGW